MWGFSPEQLAEFQSRADAYKYIITPHGQKRCDLHGYGVMWQSGEWAGEDPAPCFVCQPEWWAGVEVPALFDNDQATRNPPPSPREIIREVMGE